LPISLFNPAKKLFDGTQIELNLNFRVRQYLKVGNSLV
jgi:hypothetical protein